MAFHPNYAKNRRFYVNYTDRAGDTRVVEFRSNGRRALLGTARQLLFVDQPYSNHNGGQVQFGPDGMLYVGMGDGGAGGDPQNHGQTPSSRLAKLLRTNPLAVDWEVAGFGLRNPWRFSFDRKTGRALHRRRWSERPRGDRLPAARRSARKLRLGAVRGQPHVRQRRRARSSVAARPPGLRVRAWRRVLGHGRVRLPGQRRARGRRPILLRRLLLGQRVEPAGGRRQGDRRAARALRRGQPLVLRRGRTRRALPRLARRRRSSASLARRTGARRASRRRPRRGRVRRAAGRARPAPPRAAPAGERRPGGLRPREPEAPAGE